MTRALPHELAIVTLAGQKVDRFPDLVDRDPEVRYWHTYLVELTDEDFGMDADGWREWFAKCDGELLRLLYDDLHKEAIAIRKAREARALSWDEFLRRLKERGESL